MSLSQLYSNSAIESKSMYDFEPEPEPDSIDEKKEAELKIVALQQEIVELRRKYNIKSNLEKEREIFINKLLFLKIFKNYCIMFYSSCNHIENSTQNLIVQVFGSFVHLILGKYQFDDEINFKSREYDIDINIFTYDDKNKHHHKYTHINSLLESFFYSHQHIEIIKYDWNNINYNHGNTTKITLELMFNKKIIKLDIFNTSLEYRQNNCGMLDYAFDYDINSSILNLYNSDINYSSKLYSKKSVHNMDQIENVRILDMLINSLNKETYCHFVNSDIGPIEPSRLLYIQYRQNKILSQGYTPHRKFNFDILNIDLKEEFTCIICKDTMSNSNKKKIKTCECVDGQDVCVKCFRLHLMHGKNKCPICNTSLNFGVDIVLTDCIINKNAKKFKGNRKPDTKFIMY